VQEKKADKQRYWVTYLLKDHKEGVTFKPQEMHLTLIPWFVVNQNNDEVVESFRKEFAGEKVIKLRVGEVHEFKSRRKIPVNLIEASTEVIHLHEKTMNWFDALEARWAVKNPYVGTDYIPHIRRRPGYNLIEGSKLQIDSLSLVSANRRGDDLRTVIARVNFT
jgi:2'-5' RNA ligase